VAKPLRDVRISGGAGYLNTKILRGTLGGVDVSGNQIVNAPAKATFAFCEYSQHRPYPAIKRTELSTHNQSINPL